MARLAATFVLALALTLIGAPPGANAADADPLPSWNDGKAKGAIVEFVQKTTEPKSPDFVQVEERVATFDQDGTLWVEHPVYSQLVYVLDRVGPLVKSKPELADVEPFKTVLSGDREAIAKLTLPDLEKLAAATLTGMTVDTFAKEAKAWVDSAPSSVMTPFCTRKPPPTSSLPPIAGPPGHSASGALPLP